VRHITADEKRVIRDKWFKARPTNGSVATFDEQLGLQMNVNPDRIRATRMRMGLKSWQKKRKYTRHIVPVARPETMTVQMKSGILQKLILQGHTLSAEGGRMVLE
jgi:hypothetical protein